jgi:hypothetical protein
MKVKVVRIGNSSYIHIPKLLRELFNYDEFEVDFDRNEIALKKPNI